MNAKELRQAMLVGVMSGLLTSPLKGQSEETGKQSDFMKRIEETQGNITFHPLSEDDLLLELNQDEANLYQSLSPEGKALALKLASRSCNGMNECKGQNACRTQAHSCAGQGSCKGQTKCAFSDKNYAVKVAAKLMAEKRKNLAK